MSISNVLIPTSVYISVPRRIGEQIKTKMASVQRNETMVDKL